MLALGWLERGAGSLPGPGPTSGTHFGLFLSHRCPQTSAAAFPATDLF